MFGQFKLNANGYVTEDNWRQNVSTTLLRQHLSYFDMFTWKYFPDFEDVTYSMFY